MKRILSAAALFISMFYFCSCASSSSMSIYRENMNIPADFFGIVHAGRTGTEEEFAYLNYLGTSWVLNTFYWRRIEPEQGKWNFSDYDEFVDNNKAAGIKVLGVLAYDVGWIHTDGKGRNYIPPERLPDFLLFIQKTVENFKGRVDAWCIWNEPNMHFWTGTDDEFIELSRQTADVIREVDNEVILMGGAFNRGVFGLPEKFIRKLFESGAMDKVDAVAFHPYELNPARSVALYDRFKKIVDDYGFGDKIWVTEVGYPTGGWYPTKVREDRLPENVIKTIVLLAIRGSSRLLWYQLFDPIDRSGINSERYFGLVRSTEDYTSKGAEAFRLCSQYLSDSSCYVQEPGRDGIPNSIRMFWFKKANGGALVLWNDGLGFRQISLKLPGTEHLRHDPISGNASPVSAEIAVSVGRMPVFITWQDAVTNEEIQ